MDQTIPLDQTIPVGLASAALATAYLAWRRHYRGQRLLLVGVGWVLFFIGLAAAFQVMPYGPQLFFVGCITGAIIQRASTEQRASTDAHGSRTSESKAGRQSPEPVTARS